MIDKERLQERNLERENKPNKYEREGIDKERSESRNLETESNKRRD